VNYNKDPAVGTVTHLMVPQDDTCTDADSAANTLTLTGKTWRECMDMVTGCSPNGETPPTAGGVCCGSAFGVNCPANQADECLPGCTTYTAFQFKEGLNVAGNTCVLIQAVEADSPTEEAPNWPGTGSVCYKVEPQPAPGQG